MSEQRCVDIRKCPNIHRDDLEYPFRFVDTKDYSLDDITNYITFRPEDYKCAPDDFPNNIQEIFWAKEEIIHNPHTFHIWIACGILTNGSYFLFVAECPPDGFENTSESTMNLWLTGSWANIINEAMEEEIYERYMCN